MSPYLKSFKQASFTNWIIRPPLFAWRLDYGLTFTIVNAECRFCPPMITFTCWNVFAVFLWKCLLLFRASALSLLSGVVLKHGAFSDDDASYSLGNSTVVVYIWTDTINITLEVKDYFCSDKIVRKAKNVVHIIVRECVKHLDEIPWLVFVCNSFGFSFASSCGRLYIL